MKVVTYECYMRGTYSEATNKLQRYIGFLEDNQESLSPHHSVDVMIHAAHLKLGYMLLCGDEAIAAAEEIDRAYLLYFHFEADANPLSLP